MAETSPLSLLTPAVASFGELVRAVTDDQWDLETPCDGWDVQSLIAHVVVTDGQITSLLRREKVAWVVEVDVSVLGTNPMAAWRGTAVAMLEQFGADGVLDQQYDHPLGQVRGLRLLGNRLSENVAHGWDLATALGAEWTVTDETAEWLLSFWHEHLDALDPDWFGPMREPADDAGPLDRFLALTGRG